jgi:hypothetical protein
MTALQLFGWRKLDIGTFLKADFSIMVGWWAALAWQAVLWCGGVACVGG